MEFRSHQTIILISFALIFFHSANAICVPRNGSSPSPNVKPVSSPKTPPSSPAPSSPPPSTDKSPSPPQSPSGGKQAPSSPPPSSDKSPSPPQSPSGGKQFKRPILNALSAAIPQPGGGGGDNPVIKKICDSTDYPDVCVQTLGSFKGPGDIPNVIGAAIKAGLDLAKTALNEAEKLASQPGTPPDKASSYKDCKDSYDDAEYNFQRAVDALPGKDVGTINTMLSAAITDVGDCEDAFEGADCPLAPLSDKLTKMASNCLALVSLMH